MRTYNTCTNLQRERLVWLVVTAILGITLIVVSIIFGVSNSNRPNPEIQTTLQPNGTTPTTAPQTTTIDPNRPWLQMRLPTTLTPQNYDLFLNPNLDFWRGKVEIHLLANEPTKFILIHTKYLSIFETIVYSKTNQRTLPIQTTFNYTENQFWVIQLKSLLEKDEQIVVSLQFRGFYFDIVGLYTSFYSENGETKHLFSTKFQPTDARKAFPCLDEPGLKATYKISLEHDNSYRAWSNMPLKSVKNATTTGNWLISEFETSPVMSTYLPAILISQFGSLSDIDTYNNSTVSVLAPQSRMDQTKYALRCGVVIQEWFAKYLNYKYTLPKQDMAAIPDFPSGAMEHWGLITYRDTAMLYDEIAGTASNKQSVARIVSHELAHMWFGNLVTMKWWNDLWLNEGFASFYAGRGVQQIEPDWSMEEQGVSSSYTRAMSADSTISSHPIIVDVDTPAQITEIFDTITYSKGQAVISQLEDAMGEENFIKGLQDYLKQYEYKTASSDELYQNLQNYSSFNVKNFMDTWTKQMGYPLITIKTAHENLSSVVMERSWFLLNQETEQDAPTSPFNYKWYMFIKCGGAKISTVTFSMSTTEDELSLDLSTSLTDNPMTNPIKCNLNSRGLYRVNYPKWWWAAIANKLNSNITYFPPLDRARMLDDVLAIASSGKVSYEIAMTQVQSLQNDVDYLPWIAAQSSLQFISRQFAQDPEFGLWKKYLNKLTTKAYNHVGWNLTEKGHLQKLLQPTILSLACYSGNSDCLKETEYQFLMWKNNAVEVPSDNRLLVYQYGFKQHDNEETWNFLWNHYITSQFATEKERLLRAMAQSTHSWLINRLMDRSMNESLVRSQDFATLFGYLSLNIEKLEVVWNWCRQNWNTVLIKFGPENRRVGRMIPNLASRFNDDFRLQEYVHFIESTEPGAGARARQETLQEIKDNIRWMKTNRQELVNWLLNN